MSASQKSESGNRGENSAAGLPSRLLERAVRWKLRTRTLSFSGRPLLMGIVNVTPDSFSDGGSFAEPRAAIDHALELAAAGADLLDIGGESTRPGAQPVNVTEELRRVLPVVAGLREQTGVPLSVDTSKATVAAEAIAAGCEIINDVTALSHDPDMFHVARDTHAGLVAMHMQGTPQTMQLGPTYVDVVEEVRAYLAARRDALVAAGIDRERICLDPGIGFGKTVAHNLALLAASQRFHELGCPVLVGPSRKRFIAEVCRDPDADRTAGTIGVSCWLASQGIQVLRVHDVSAVRQALMLYEAAGGLSDGTG
jgi:dihydropteroate synthase